MSNVWRNVLRHRDIPWLQHHSVSHHPYLRMSIVSQIHLQLGNAAVFPAAAHMSLAIEALRQIHEVHELPFDVVTLRAINIKTALVIPETEDGIEIQLRLQRFPGAPARDSWYTFFVESILDGQWTSHCEGTIAANIHITKSEQDYKSPVNISKLNQRVPGRRWYDAFSRVGFEYTGSFQQLKSIRTNRKFHEAAAEVKVLNESGLIQGESRYIVHPATVDACLQLIIISINAGLHKQMACGVVPIKVDEVNFWFPGGDLGSAGSAVAWTDSFEPRYFNTHTKLMGESGNLIMDVKGLRCVAYEAAVPPQAIEDRPPQPYMESCWMPDLSTLTMAKLAELWHGSSVAQVVSKLVELLDHKYELKSLLLLGRPKQALLDTLLQHLPAATSVTIAYMTAEQMDSHGAVDEIDDRISTILLPAIVEEWSDSLPGIIDLVIVEENLAHNATKVGIFRALKSVVNQQGWLITSSNGAGCDKLTAKLLSSEWSVSKLSLASDETALLCTSATHTNGVDHSTGNITMLSLEKEISSNDNICEAMTSFGANTARKGVQDFDASVDLRVVITDLLGTLLIDIQNDTFAALQAILSAPVSILWLTKGVKEGRSISGSMAEGLLRVIRSEQAAARIVFLDFDTNEKIEDVGKAIVTKLEDSVTKHSGGDTEFWLHAGTLHIDRVSANSSLNVEKASVVSETQTLSPGAPISGDIREGRLSFKLISSVPVILMDGWVEIQVKASDLQKSVETPSLVVGQVFRVGPNVGSYFVGKDVVAYVRSPFSTLVQTAVWEPVNSELNSISLIASLPSLCKAVNASIRVAKIQHRERVLLLPAPMALMHAFIRLSQILDWEVTVVAKDEQERKVYELAMDSHAVLLTKNIRAIGDFVQSHAAPGIIIAHEFSALSKEVWRLITPSGRFILNEAPIDSPPEVLPFARGASFLTAHVPSLIKQDEKAARKLLRTTLSIFLTNQQQLTLTRKTYDIGDINLAEAQDNVESVVAYNYGKSSIQVRQNPYSKPWSL